MTEQHPLTDEMCKKISRFGARSYLSMTQFSLDERARMMELDVYYDMRAAYDKGREDRLDEVIEWLRATRYYGRVADLADQLEEAMRPQQQQEDNW